MLMYKIKERYSKYYWLKSFIDEKMTMNINPYLSFLQRPWVAIFLQTFRFNSELNSGIPKHSSRGTQSASVVATIKGHVNLLVMHKFIYYNWPGFLNWGPWIFIDSSHPSVGWAGERTRGKGKEYPWISEIVKNVFEDVHASEEKVIVFIRCSKWSFTQLMRINQNI